MFGSSVPGQETLRGVHADNCKASGEWTPSESSGEREGEEMFINTLVTVVV
jgi:hypothetical protein